MANVLLGYKNFICDDRRDKLKNTNIEIQNHDRKFVNIKKMMIEIFIFAEIYRVAVIVSK